MDETVCVILLLTGFCVASTSFHNIYHFIGENKTWNEARDYCITKYTALAQIYDKEDLSELMKTSTGGYTEKAWIGLYERARWIWVNGQSSLFFNWSGGEPNGTDPSGFCVTITDDGSWKGASCSELKPSVCFKGNTHSIVEEKLTWEDAVLNCRDQASNLATVSNDKGNSEIKIKLSRVTEAWIGLRLTNMWYWSALGKTSSFTNWESGQPDSLSRDDCAAIVVKNGTWTDEQCEAAYPFFCYEVRQLRKTVVRMKIQSSANMEDPACRADLQQKLSAAFANQGVIGFKLTLKKLPVKKTQETSDKDACRPWQTDFQKGALRH